MTGRRTRLAAGSLALCLAGCGSADSGPARRADPAVTSSPPADGQLRQYRGDAVRRLLQVTLTAREPLHVTTVSLSAGGFAPLPPTSHDVDLPVDGRVDLPVRYGPAQCDREPGRAVATLSRPDGPPVDVALDDAGLLERIHAAECAEQELRRQVDLRVGPGFTEQLRDGRRVLVGSLEVERRAPGSRVVVEALGANIVYSVRADGDTPAGQPERRPLLELGADEPFASLPLELAPTRCDPHALAESKATSLILVHVGLGDAAARLLTVTPEPATRLVLEEFAVRGCRS